MAASDFVASEPHTRTDWLVPSQYGQAIYAGILYFILYGPISVASESAMSRKSPQSISPPRGSRHTRPESDANIRNFAPVARIMKTALPENAKIAKEAKECMQECVSEFISFITSEGMHPPSISCDVRYPFGPLLTFIQPRRNVSKKSGRR